MKIEPSTSKSAIVAERWQNSVSEFRKPNLTRAVWQIVNTFVPFFFIWFLMYFSLSYSYWFTLALAPLAAGFHLRLFMIFHDCTHSSFFKSQRANSILGSICGYICFTPYFHWRYFHSLHHATTGNLTKRLDGKVLPMHPRKYMQTNGDVLTLTVNEYCKLSKVERLTYRTYRILLLFLVLMPLFIFVVTHRFASPMVDKKAKNSVYWTNLVIALAIIIMSFTIGFVPFLLVELPIIAISSTVGVWLFYIQHQFKETYWQEQDEWDFAQAALQGSSYYKLPLVLQWFTSNIGFHHVHHLSPRIPNYNLKKCHESSSLFQKTKPLTFMTGLKSIFYRLWDEEDQKMVSFRQVTKKEFAKSLSSGQIVASAETKEYSQID